MLGSKSNIYFHLTASFKLWSDITAWHCHPEEMLQSQQSPLGVWKIRGEVSSVLEALPHTQHSRKRITHTQTQGHLSKGVQGQPSLLTSMCTLRCSQTRRRMNKSYFKKIKNFLWYFYSKHLMTLCL